MKRVFALALTAGYLAAAPAASAQDVGAIPYLRDSFDALEDAFIHYGMRRTGDYRTNALAAYRWTDVTIRLTEPGMIAVGCDRDCNGINLAYVEGSGAEARVYGAVYGNRWTALSYEQAGTYTVRVSVTGCQESICYFGVMAGYR